MAIEARTFDEKDELIARFYTLRAGLSVIAAETQKFKKNNDEMEDLKYYKKNHEEKLNRLAKEETRQFETERAKHLTQLRQIEAEKLSKINNGINNYLYAKEQNLKSEKKRLRTKSIFYGILLFYAFSHYRIERINKI